MSALFLCSTLLTYPLPHSAARAQECFAVTEGVLWAGASKSEQCSQTKTDAALRVRSLLLLDSYWPQCGIPKFTCFCLLRSEEGAKAAFLQVG